MGELSLHQLVHGYAHGHVRLAGSTRLGQTDESLIARISDLSGPLLGETRIPPYFTGYPLPRGSYYVLSRTWLDEAAARAGSVLTHSLVIPQHLIGQLGRISNLTRLLKERPSLSDLSAYAKPIPASDAEGVSLHGTLPDREEVLGFVTRYFRDGRRPVLWLDLPNPDAIVEYLWEFMRPRLRQEFAFCTLSLQLRSLDDRPFDLLFAPSQRLGKHRGIPEENVIAEGRDAASSTDSRSAGRWETALVSAILSPQSERTTFSEELAELWPHLGPEPTQAARAFRLRELRTRNGVSGQALAGAMDLLSSLVPSAGQAIALKTRIVLEGLHALTSDKGDAGSLKGLHLVSDRLARPAFSRVGPHASSSLEDAVEAYACEDPNLAMEVGKEALEGDRITPYIRGLARGLARYAEREPNGLGDLWTRIASSPVLIADQPSLAQAIYGAFGDTAEVSRLMSRTIGLIKGAAPRRGLRDKLLPLVVSAEDAVLARELLRDVGRGEVTSTLDCIAAEVKSLQKRDMQAVLSDQIARAHSRTVKEWARSTATWSYGVAQVVADAFESSQEGLVELVSFELQPVRRATVIAAYLENAKSPSLADWLTTLIRSDERVLRSLLIEGIQQEPGACNTVHRLLDEIPDASLTVDEELVSTMEVFRATEFWESLVDVAMARLLSQFASGRIGTRVFRRWADAPFVREWFGRTSAQALWAAIEGDASVTRWERAWSVLEFAPATLTGAGRAVAAAIIARLLECELQRWTPKTTRGWIRVIDRAGEEGNSKSHFRLCEQAVSYAFHHPDQPLSPLVVKGFPVVYAAALQDSKDALPFSVFAILLFPDWDRARELRQRIVDVYHSSRWPPEDLALSMPDDVTLRKVLARMKRKPKGGEFVRKLAAGLERRRTQRAAHMLDVVREWLDSGTPSEQWI